MTNELDILRQNIDSLDDSIINLLAKRLRVVCQVGEYKRQKGLPSIDKSRWKEVLTSKMAKAKTLGVNPQLVKKIYDLIHIEALKIEKNIKL